MTYAKPLLIVLGISLSGMGGYYIGHRPIPGDIRQKETWSQMDLDVSGNTLIAALRYGDWDLLTPEEARKSLSAHLDAANVPHGDMVVPSQKVHSGRYLVSQWQRLAAGTAIMVLGRDGEGDLCIALGPQRGNMVPPQGYMEARLPKDDATGLREKGASRFNKTTGEVVSADRTLEDNAVREVKEELGIHISKDDLHLLSIGSSEIENPVVPTIAGKYAVILEETAPLGTLDLEFIDDDMQNPIWVKVKDITCENGACHIPGTALPIEAKNITSLQKAISKLGNEADHQAGAAFLAFEPPL